MDFVPYKTESDIWMRKNQGLYEHIAVYVDDIMVAATNPSEIIKLLESEHKFKIKGVGPMQYHLGCDYFRDEDGTLCFGPRKYIDKFIEV